MLVRIFSLMTVALFLSGCSVDLHETKMKPTALHHELSYSPSSTDFVDSEPKLSQNFMLPGLAAIPNRDWDRYVELAPRAHAACLPNKLKNIVVKAGKYFGQKVIITSAHRSARRNRRVGGAKGSYHIRCQAVDLRVKGVSKSALARFIRKLPDRGGLGTYCGKGIVHVDLGPRREWHYGCRRKRRRMASRKRSSISAALSKRLRSGL